MGKDLIGQRFGKLVVLSRSEGVAKDGSRIWNCICDCGANKKMKTRALVHDNIRSCGCLLKWNDPNYKKRTHYRLWYHMIDRCYNTKNISYHNYGAKRISVCDEWRNDYWEFHKWVVKNNFVKGLQIDRFPDKNGNYEPLNCRLATSKMNQNNRTNNVVVEFNGVKKTISEWADEYNKSRTTVCRRFKAGWGIKLALETNSWEISAKRKNNKLK